jgi:hypothetical protein
MVVVAVTQMEGYIVMDHECHTKAHTIYPLLSEKQWKDIEYGTGLIRFMF